VVQGKVYTSLYRSEPAEAWKTIQANWPNYKSSMLIRLQKVRVDVLNLRANCALSTARVGHADAQKLRKDAAWCAKSLAQEGLPWPSAIATQIHASLAVDRGEYEAAANGFLRAAEQFDGCEMKLAASVARRRRGELLGGSEGDSIVEASNAVMRSEQIVSPAKFSRVYCPSIPHA
jgi:hypothetical protein